MTQTPEQLLESQRTRFLGALEDCCVLARMGDFHQAALRLAEFRRDLDGLLSAEEIYQESHAKPAMQSEARGTFPALARSLAEEAWNRLVRSEVEPLISTCGTLSGAVDDHFRHEAELARDSQRAAAQRALQRAPPPWH